MFQRKLPSNELPGKEDGRLKFLEGAGSEEASIRKWLYRKFHICIIVFEVSDQDLVWPLIYPGSSSEVDIKFIFLLNIVITMYGAKWVLNYQGLERWRECTFLPKEKVLDTWGGKIYFFILVILLNLISENYIGHRWVDPLPYPHTLTQLTHPEKSPSLH